MEMSYVNPDTCIQTYISAEGHHSTAKLLKYFGT